MGRKGFGVTRKVSITLTEEEWYWVEKLANKNLSSFLRHAVRMFLRSAGIHFVPDTTSHNIY